MSERDSLLMECPELDSSKVDVEWIDIVKTDDVKGMLRRLVVDNFGNYYLHYAKELSDGLIHSWDMWLRPSEMGEVVVEMGRYDHEADVMFMQEDWGIRNSEVN